MKSELKTFIPFLDFISKVLGKNTEIVLQEVIDEKDSSIIYIKNNISGRKIGSPATDFLLKILQSKKYKEQDYVVDYSSQTNSGKILSSSSFFIKDNSEKLIGMVCINSDKGDLVELNKLLKKTSNQIQILLKPNESPQQKINHIHETLYITSENMIDQTVQSVMGVKPTSDIKLSKKDKLTIVSQLYNRGFFELKDAVAKVAKVFNVSEVSIYKYLQEIKSSKNS